MTSRIDMLLVAGLAAVFGGIATTSVAEEPLPWQLPPAQGYQGVQSGGAYDAEPAPDPYRPGAQPAPLANDAYRPDQYQPSQQAPTAYRPAPVEPYQPDYGGSAGRYQGDDGNGYRGDDRGGPPDPGRETYSRNEVVDAGHRFFGSLSSGLAKAVEWAFQHAGRPNGYILGEGAGGAFIAGLRYGEGKLYTKHAGVHRVFWQGPSLGYDFGGDGTRTMILVYNLRSPRDMYTRFAGVQGSAYLVGGASVQLLKGDEVTLAPIRTGVGLRLGANIGYLKFTRRPTWNPF